MMLHALFTLLALAGAPPNLDDANRLYPDADAVILSWEQTFAERADGTRSRRDHRFVLLRDPRAFGRYADQRIDWRDGADKVTIHAARTYLPGGGVLEVPDHGRNVASPGDVAGWPAFASWRQTIVNFIGLEAGAVVELDYEVEEGPGGAPFLSADLRIGERDPTVVRVVDIAVPASTSVDGVEFDLEGRRFTFREVPGSVDEPMAPPWPLRCGRFRFTACPDVASFVRSFLEPAEVAAVADEAVKAFAAKAAGDEPDPLVRLEKLVASVRASLTILESPRTWTGRKFRRASEVLASAYGSEPEAAILLAACVRALGMEARLRLALDVALWNPDCSTDTAFSALVVKTGDLCLHPVHGPVWAHGAWANVYVTEVDTGGKLLSDLFPARGGVGNLLRVTGTLVLDTEGRLSGELRTVLTGRFFDPTAVKDSKAREGFLRALAGRVVTGLDLKTEALEELTPGLLSARITVASAPLPKVGGRFLLEFGAGPLSLETFPLPLTASERRTPVCLPGAFTEHVEIVVRLPEAFGKEPLRLTRKLEIPRTIPPEPFARIRDELSSLRAPAGRIFPLGPR